MKFVLHLKHWQLFALTFGIPFTLYISLVATMMGTMITTPDLRELPIASLVMAGVTLVSWLVSIAFSISWVYQLATGLHSKLPSGHTMKLRRFYLAFFYPMVYLTIVVVCMGWFAYYMIQLSESGGQPDPSNFIWFILIIPFHFLALFCMFYVLYFNAKSLKSVELQRIATMNDYIGEFFLLWFSVIGIWLLQPRINQIFSDKPQSPAVGAPLDQL